MIRGSSWVVRIPRGGAYCVVLCCVPGRSGDRGHLMPHACTLMPHACTLMPHVCTLMPYTCTLCLPWLLLEQLGMLQPGIGAQVCGGGGGLV